VEVLSNAREEVEAVLCVVKLQKHFRQHLVGQQKVVNVRACVVATGVARTAR